MDELDHRLSGFESDDPVVRPLLSPRLDEADLASELRVPLVGGDQAEGVVLDELARVPASSKSGCEGSLSGEVRVPDGSEAVAVDPDSVNQLDQPGAV